MILRKHYDQELLLFLRTLNITNRWFGAQQADQIRVRYGLDSVDPRMNPYYLQTCGFYPQGVPQMVIRTIETGAEVPFTRTVLESFPKTRAAYSIGSQFWVRLTETYPDQTELIKSILYPVGVIPAYADPNSAQFHPRRASHYHGEYFAGDEGFGPDQIIMVTSVDTGATIEFTRANLHGDHPLTLAKYRMPSQAGISLLAKYPSLADLIFGIIYPECPAEAVAGLPHLTLLTYDDRMLDPNERDSLLGTVKDFLDYYRTRWSINEFTFETYYGALHWTTMLYGLLTHCHQQRIANKRTWRVHDYLVWEYLLSNGFADYRTVLTRRQTMFLYRNFRYLSQRKGTNECLQALVDGLLRGMNITINEKHLVWNSQQLPELAHPTIEVVNHRIGRSTTAINDMDHGVTAYEDLFLDKVVSGLEPSADLRIRDQQISKIQRAGKTRVVTKLLELQRLDLSRRQYLRYLEFVRDTFLHLWSQDRIYYRVHLTFPNLGIVVDLNVGECFALVDYLTGGDLAGGDKPDPARNIPSQFWVRGVFQPRATIQSNVPVRCFAPHPAGGSAGDWIRLKNAVNPTPIVDLVDDITGTIVDGSDFITALDHQYDALVLADQVAHATANTERYAAINAIRTAMFDLANWADAPGNFRLLELTEDTRLVPAKATYADWFNDMGDLEEVIEHYCKTAEGQLSLAHHIFTQAFPIDQSPYSGGYRATREQYLALRDIFTRMISYSVAFLETDPVPSEYLSLNPILLRSRISGFNLAPVVVTPFTNVMSHLEPVYWVTDPGTPIEVTDDYMAEFHRTTGVEIR